MGCVTSFLILAHVLSPLSGVLVFIAGTVVKVKPSKSLRFKMLRSTVIFCAIIGFTGYVWSTSVYECITILYWDFCGTIGQGNLVYYLVAFDTLITIYLAVPFLTYFSLKHTVQAKNTNKPL